MTEEKSFNSRPHKEVDNSKRIFCFILSLSIHDLTRRSTALKRSIKKFYSLSIHDLTRRSTHIYSISVGKPVFQFTTSQGGRLLASARIAEEGGFQFTTSQGGRRCPDSGHQARPSFNSRPHKEVDPSSKA